MELYNIGFPLRFHTDDAYKIYLKFSYWEGHRDISINIYLNCFEDPNQFKTDCEVEKINI